MLELVIQKPKVYNQWWQSGDLHLFWGKIPNCSAGVMTSRVGWLRDTHNWHVEDWVIKLPVTEQPLCICQYEPWQAEKMNWARMSGFEIKNSKLLYLSSTANRLKEHFMEKPFSVCNMTVSIQCFTLKDSLCNSLPGPEMLKRPISPYIEIGCISAVTNWITFLSCIF